MGGGDLNMKKHFHPLTMENLERVWKAEEKKRLEEEKMKQLSEELRQERQREELQKQAVSSGIVKKKSEKLDWMYSHMQAVNAEAYLLGKRIDKNVESMKDEEKKVDLVPKEKVLAPKASDILAKVKEDPLFMIKKKEEENRIQLVQNPMKMKKIRALLAETVTEELKKKDKKKKSKKKHKKRNRRSSSSDRSPSPKLKELKHKKIRREIQEKNLYNAEHSNRSDDEDQEKRRKKERRRSVEREESVERKMDRHHNNTSRVKKERYSPYRRDKDREYSSETKRREDTYRERKRNLYNKKRRRHSETSSDESKSDSDDEMEKKRQQMIQNAEWRQNQRLKNFSEFEKEKEKEEESLKSSRGKTNIVEEKAQFIKKMQVQSYSSKDTSSVEDRIRRTIHSKQRTNAALNKKFTAR